MLNKIKYRYLESDDIDSIMFCVSSSYDNMEFKNYFVPPTYKYLFDILNSIGKSIGAFYNNTMVGVASFVYPNKAKISLYEYQCFCKNKDCLIQFEHGAVIPQFQGNGILADMLHIVCNDFYQLGYKYIISSVHPLNYPSLKTAFGIKQKAVNIVKLYDNNIRYIMVGELQINAFNHFFDIKHLPPFEYNEILKLMEGGFMAFDIDSFNQTLMLGRLQ